MSTNIGFWTCIALVVLYAAMGLLFVFFKDKVVWLVTGFNTLPKEELDLYDKAYMVKDMRNSCFLWSFVMLAGAVGCFFLSGYFAIVAFIVLAILLIKDMHLDAHKAFEKYRRS